jgi:hypothetical protein
MEGNLKDSNNFQKTKIHQLKKPESLEIHH